MIKILMRRLVRDFDEIPSYLHLSWSVATKFQSKFPIPQDWESYGYEVLKVTADGEELRWIGMNFTNLPRANPVLNTTQTWRGDLAAFIVDHLTREPSPESIKDRNEDFESDQQVW